MPHECMELSLSLYTFSPCFSSTVVLLLLEKFKRYKVVPQVGLVVEDIMYHIEKKSMMVLIHEVFGICEICVGILSYDYIGTLES